MPFRTWGDSSRQDDAKRHDQKGMGMQTDFDSRAETWDSDPAKVERARVIADKIRSAIPLHAQMNALEYGCGTGLLSFPLQRDLGHITLADTSEGMLAVLREKIASTGARNMKPVQLDLLCDPLPGERFDLIYSMLTLHHIPDTARILSAFHALLKPGGYLCIADLDKEDGSFHGPGFSGHNGFDRSDLEAKAANAGFEQISFSTAHAMEKSLDGENRRFPVFLMVARRP